jgi:hypothetical protein
MQSKGQNERLKMLEKREEWFQEREREALSDDPVTKEAREVYIKALQAAWDNHNPHEGPCYCLWKFMWALSRS